MRGETAGAVEFSGRRGDKNCGVKVVEVNPKPRKGIVSKLIDLLETVIVKFMYDRSAKPFPFFLTGNFAPVAYETPPQKDLPVKGRLPECLNGEFVRIGPNSKFAPLAGYHWFDGDGMVHGMLIKDGKATYISRYVRTSRLKQEEFFGAAKFFKVGDLKGLFGLLMVYLQRLRAKLKVLDMLYGTGKANTALVYHSGKLLALHEGDKPYVLKVMEDGDLQTLGLQDYDKRLTHSFTAHPKVDPVTGEMFAFGYSQAPPYVSYRVISNDGFMDDPVHVTIPASIMMHDFAITENYAIFMDLPMYFKPKDMVKENKLAYTFDKTVDAHFGILPRYAKNDLLMKWFELPSCFIFHNANAWEEGDEIVLVTCRYETIEMDTDGTTTSGMIQTSSSELYEMRFNMKTGLASQRQLSVASIEFPRINEKYTGRKSRYAYGAVINDLAKITAIVKFDLHGEPNTNQRNIEVGGNVRGIFSLGPQVFGSEAVFVPRGADDSSTTEAEDDGYLLFFGHDENIGKSWVYVIDASTMSADPVAMVELPHRVPYGFHALFVSQEQLDDQG